jgi:A/G-specific adenine glycosylase
MLNNALVSSVQTTVLEWYGQQARNLPWRTFPADPYMVLVSEVMLQQTQVARIAEFLPRFLKLFPTIRDLAKATNAEIIRAWKGLGYNARALRLRDTAERIVSEFGGRIPSDPEVLRILPGIGAYTSAAIACFAYGRRCIVLDVNIRRLYSRLHHQCATTADVVPDEELSIIADQLIPTDAPDTWHHAVMDLGATICTARLPRCSQCPLFEVCPSAGVMSEASKPRREEPSFEGKPNRIWRGRIVDVLRTETGFLTEEELFAKVFQRPMTADADREWLHATITGLRSVGIVHRLDLRLKD